MVTPLGDLPIEAIRAALRPRAVRLAYVFGSFARGTPDARSDLDLALLMPDPWNPRKTFALAAQVAAEVSALIRRPTDVVILNQAGALLRFEAALRGVAILVEDHEERVRFELRVRDQYEDFRHFQSIHVEELWARLGILAV